MTAALQTGLSLLGWTFAPRVDFRVDVAINPWLEAMFVALEKHVDASASIDDVMYEILGREEPFCASLLGTILQRITCAECLSRPFPHLTGYTPSPWACATVAKGWKRARTNALANPITTGGLRLHSLVAGRAARRARLAGQLSGFALV